MLILIFIFLPKIESQHFVFNATQVASAVSSSTSTAPMPTAPAFLPDYVSTPEPLKAIYMTSWMASSEKLRAPLINLIDTTELNAVVIDIKDYSGMIVFPVTDPALKAYGSENVRVPDMQAFVASLHQKGIYVIARIATFQDAFMVKARPDLAVKNKAGTAVWKDHGGISWIDPGATEYWDYIILLARQARAIGFDEVNFDYIRFPSDGNLEDISYPFSSTTPKTEVLKKFFSYLDQKLAEDDGTPKGDEPAGEVPKGVTGRLKISADIFGQTTTNKDDMGIGQLFENVLPYFDYVSPMVYPSHYITNFDGFKNPEEHPYEIVLYAMKSAVAREKTLASSTAQTSSSTPKLAELRPWLQDFGLTMDYGPTEVRDQIKATYDSGLTSWMFWSASNKYTVGALNAK